MEANITQATNFWFRRYRYRLIFVALFLFGLGGWYVLNAINSYQIRRCYETGLTLSSEERRSEVVRNFLNIKLKEVKERNEYGGEYKFVLLPKKINADDLIVSIKNKEILDLVHSSVFQIEGRQDIEKLDLDTLKNNFTVFIYSEFRREMQVMLGTSIEEIEPLLVKNVFEEKSWLNLTKAERQRGYGKILYGIESYAPIYLACCDQLDPQHEKPQWKYVRENIDLINWTKQRDRRYLVASSCGGIMTRRSDDSLTYLF